MSYSAFYTSFTPLVVRRIIVVFLLLFSRSLGGLQPLNHPGCVGRMILLTTSACQASRVCSRNIVYRQEYPSLGYSRTRLDASLHIGHLVRYMLYAN